MRRLRIPAVLASIALLAGLFTVAPGAQQPASAAVASDFQAGNIISDALFYDGGSMSAGQVQSFLNAARPSCRSGYTCLKNYGQATPNRSAVAGRCAAYAGASLESAATIIAKVGAACGISQKVLIVMLEKEQSLITDDWPSDRQYRSAMGYGCPDTADCDTTYYGFFNQVYAAALQFKNYQANPTRWNHVAGRVNAVRYNPNAACGSSNVFIQNAATAGLYNYTPYQPNASALANLYGSGDGCGAYGNRNFWRLYTDWFGSTTGGGSLVRTTANANIYLVTDTRKYLIRDSLMLAAYAPLGPVTYVSQSYLDRYTTMQPASRIIRAPNGGIFFTDASIKLGFPTCDMVVDYGGACNDNGWTQLTQAQIDAFVAGPVVTPVYATTAGARYWVTGGTKREIADAQSQAEAGLSPVMMVLTEGGIEQMPSGAPIIRESGFVVNRGTSEYTLISGGARLGIDPDTVNALGLKSRSTGALWSKSFYAVPGSPSSFSGVVRANGSTTSVVLTATGRYDWLGDANGTVLPYLTVNQSLIDSYKPAGSLGDGSVVKPSGGYDIYVLAGGKAKYGTSWDTIYAAVGTTAVTVVDLGPAVISAIPKNSVLLKPGTIVSAAGDPRVYLIDGLGTKRYVPSFDRTTQMGIAGVRAVDRAALDAYVDPGGPLAYGITCGSASYVSAAASLHPVDAATKALYAFEFTTLSDSTCKQIPKGSPAGKFIRTPDDGRIYYLEGGQKKYVASPQRLAELGGGGGNYLNVSLVFASLIASGPNA